MNQLHIHNDSTGTSHSTVYIGQVTILFSVEEKEVDATGREGLKGLEGWRSSEGLKGTFSSVEST